ncbi:tRNA (adenine(22)-N(1))-methyltransferase [Streptococcus cuniculipharyngis]|uniref:tRNA (Adenine-N(1))-methyltransferase n=1 Tax=Streptococcus cuniculipharyngis TaxID=1562651 RepID=A0A5C5SDS2_9STRE|nr:tRNA (adenine(22)-N(1))-methyltransferase TrmK [Streptococcus cuniculipharyngis]TWS98015.1 tRNA (adenine-N(1))-methyltransferase [Streptococcus cuniculipharyngis]
MEAYLSQRLQAVASYVPKGARLLDVGSDHAYLPLALMSQGLLDFAIAGEVVAGPYQSALTNVAQAGFSEQISVRLANGLAAFEEKDRISVITICGMGGRLIAEILENGKAKLHPLQRLILQANNREDELRQWLLANHFTIVAEEIVQENDKIYEIIVAEPGQSTLSSKDLRFGPYLRLEKSPVFLKKWTKELAKLNQALQQIPVQYETDRSAIGQKIEAIKEVLNES